MTTITQERVDYDLKDLVIDTFDEYLSNRGSKNEWCHYIFENRLGIAMWPLGDIILTRLIMNIDYRWMIVESPLFNACYCKELSNLYKRANKIINNKN